MTKYTNNLINETSPYLLQHAHNPVNWYAWKHDVLELAKREDKPILVSIGYSACHWCHVMEKESFEDEDTAEIMNGNFINIKIDREERPDLDQIYMDAVQAMTGSGGWPLNVFLTPDAKPFYGGTYFPPERAYNRASWKEILIAVSNAFKEKRGEIEAQAENLTKHVSEANSFGVVDFATIKDEEDLFSINDVMLIDENILKSADKKWGGFGTAPKFPQTFLIRFLLRHHHYTKNPESLKQACLSLDKMIDGGIYDQIGGGFSRYSTDSEWLVPHFEKMLYDNALIVMTLSEAYQVTRNKRYENAINETLEFICRELGSDEGGFYSAVDADSEGEEGKYYFWEKSEVGDVLKDNAEIFCSFYNVLDSGNWHEANDSGNSRNILHVTRDTKQFALEWGLEESMVSGILEECRKKLLNLRMNRTAPKLDDKILLGWNALMNTALSYAFSAIQNNRWREIAVKNELFLSEKFKNNGRGCFHTYKNGQAKITAFLDDYAFLIQSYLELNRINSDHSLLQKAKNLAGYVIEGFYDNEQGMFFYTHKDQQDLIVRKKEIFDGAIPSGNSVMALNLYLLSIAFNRRDWKELAISMVERMRSVASKYPISFGLWAMNVQTLFYHVNEFAIVGKDYETLRDELNSLYLPNKILLSGAAESDDYDLLKNRKPKPDETFIYHCKNYSCDLPVKAVNSLGKIL